MNDFLIEGRSIAKRLFVLALVVSLTSGCASILKGTTQTIPINSDPPEADILVDGNFVGVTPLDVEMQRKRDHLVTIQKDDYRTGTVAVVKNIGGAVWGNILAGGVIGWGVDAATGAQYNLAPETIFIRLDPVGEGGEQEDSSDGISDVITRLNELDLLRENDQISDEEYTRVRVALLTEHFPELVPEEAEEAVQDNETEANQIPEPDR